ncbi:unnamed protein product [Dicrocoelium dendriticum]|nr:unnamed protein product [Dicrocoelium dendriticum]
MMSKLAILFAALIHLAPVVWSMNFTSCGSQIGSLVDVSIKPCNFEPCLLYTETTVDLNIQFTANKIIQSGQAAINATFYGYSFTLGLYNDSLCAYTQPGCPIQADGTVYTYTYAVYISPSFIPVSLDII